MKYFNYPILWIILLFSLPSILMAKFKKVPAIDPLYERVKAEAFNTVSNDKLRHDNYHYLTRLAKWYTLRIKNGSDELTELTLMKNNIKMTLG